MSTNKKIADLFGVDDLQSLETVRQKLEASGFTPMWKGTHTAFYLHPERQMTIKIADRQEPERSLYDLSNRLDNPFLPKMHDFCETEEGSVTVMEGLTTWQMAPEKVRSVFHGCARSIGWFPRGDKGFNAAAAHGVGTHEEAHRKLAETRGEQLFPIMKALARIIEEQAHLGGLSFHFHQTCNGIFFRGRDPVFAIPLRQRGTESVESAITEAVLARRRWSEMETQAGEDRLLKTRPSPTTLTLGK